MLRISILTWRQLKATPIRNTLSVLSITFGVALFTSIDLVNDSTLKSFTSGIEAISGKASFSLMAGHSGFSETLLEEVEKTPGIKSAIPVIETQAYFMNPKTRATETLNILGVDLLRESSVRAYQMSEKQVLDDPLSFLNQPDSLIITSRFAKEHTLKVGDSVQFSVSSGIRELKVRGILIDEGPAKAYGGNLGIMDIDGARLQFGKIGKLDRIDVIIESNTHLEEVRNRLESRFHSRLNVESTASQSESMRRLVEGYQGLLSFVGILALIVGLFLVMNSMTIAVAERRKQIGILRALGANRALLMRLLIEEGLVIGIAGSLLGVSLGKEVARHMSGLVTRALSNQYLIPVYLDRLELSREQIFKAIFLGTATTLIACIMAGKTALSIEPIEVEVRRWAVTRRHDHCAFFE
jgi:putative ABC transport system permease protein